MSKIRVNMLGGMQIFFNDENVTEFLSSKSKALLCYMLTENRKSYFRDLVASLFWGESKQKAARYNLRYNLWSINKVFQGENSEHLIIGSLDRIYINNKNYLISTDVWDIKDMLSQYESSSEKIKILNSMKNIYCGNYLEGYHFKDCFKFNDWVFYQREEIQKIYFDVLKTLEILYNNNDDYANSISLLRLMLKINPLDEEMYLKIIKLCLKKNEKSLALSYYNKCIQILREELNISPSEELLKLYDIIRLSSNKSILNSVEEGNNYGKLNVFDNSLYNKSINLENGYIFDIICLPIEGLKYGVISQIIDEALNYVDLEGISDNELGFWKVIAILNPKVSASLNIDFSLFNFEKKPQDITIFNALLCILNQLNRQSPVVLGIRNFQLIDIESFKFIKYILFNKSGFKGKIYITGQEWDNKIREIKSYIS